MQTQTPQCIGIILDGNRRWAKEKGLPTFEGHREGMVRLLDTVRWVRNRDIPHIAVYAFSIENWNRDHKEVSYLMELFHTAFEKHFQKLSKEQVRIRFVGERSRFNVDMQQIMDRIEKESATHNALTLWVCLSYGGRAEIVAAAQKAAAQGEITEKTLAAHLWTAEMPDPDIIIRTGDEKRLSNFLTWQSVYSELFFVDAYWPDFSETLLDSILTAYGKRERRMGK